ncbi:MAG TPA: carboxypeptidase-like regulatory domain-containing protein [Pyrinomonadaceae bacterium]|nr:carboxypeptidase-like regulatory domain-containing protein [Pyrinomonadaceae bacterium]
MISSTFKTFKTFKASLLILAFCLAVSAQDQDKKTPTSTISGKVTMRGRAVPGVVVVARLTQSLRSVRLTDKTDSVGNYRITNVPPGTYEIAPSVTQYALTGPDVIKSLIVSEGETFDAIDFTLLRGGVITGRVTDSEGKPIIDEEIFISGPEGTAYQETVNKLGLIRTTTDDRGIYRMFGLPPGKYTVAAGTDEERFFLKVYSRFTYRRTFHPSTTDPAKATLIEVTDGGEATNVDIVLRRRLVGYTVTGRVVDAASGNPQPSIRYSLTRYRQDGWTSHGGMFTDAQGGFVFDGLPPGKYAVSLARSPDSDNYAEPVPFEIVDKDLEGLTLKLVEGGIISGSIVMEGVDEKVARTKFPNMTVISFIETNRPTAEQGSPTTPVNADGTFRLAGLGSGVVRFSIMTGAGESTPEFELARVERSGEIVARGIEIKEGQKIGGVRLIVKNPSGAIRGELRIQNGQIPTDGMVVFVRRVGQERSHSANVDARGRFHLGGLATGVYEVSLMSVGRPSLVVPAVKEVVVTDNQTSEVILTIDLKDIAP